MRYPLCFLILLTLIGAYGQNKSREHALVLAKNGDLQEAVRIIDQLIADDPKRASYYFDKANYLLELKAYEEMFETLSLGINMVPDSVGLYDIRGTLLEQAGLFTEAIQDFTTALDKTTNKKQQSHLLANRGGTKARIQDFQGAYADLVASTKLDPENIDALNNLAAVCDEVNKAEETLFYLNKVISLQPGYAPAYINIGFRYQALQQHKTAVDYFNKAIGLDPDQPLAYSNRSFSKLKLKDIEGALADINHSIRLMPGNSYAFKIRALIKIEQHLIKDACADLQEALSQGYTQQYGKEVEELISRHCQ